MLSIAIPQAASFGYGTQWTASYVVRGTEGELGCSFRTNLFVRDTLQAESLS